MKRAAAGLLDLQSPATFCQPALQQHEAQLDVVVHLGNARRPPAGRWHRRTLIVIVRRELETKASIYTCLTTEQSGDATQSILFNFNRTVVGLFSESLGRELK